ncbi:5-methyltetrahydropteroyltriglutamate-homocysteine methyltransferase, partial [Mycobacterium tuberculosis TB_RSA169]
MHWPISPSCPPGASAGLRGCGRAVKVQAPGPVTLVAGLELANGHRA